MAVRVLYVTCGMGSIVAFDVEVQLNVAGGARRRAHLDEAAEALREVGIPVGRPLRAMPAELESVPVVCGAALPQKLGPRQVLAPEQAWLQYQAAPTTVVGTSSAAWSAWQSLIGCQPHFASRVPPDASPNFRTTEQRGAT
ncbi:unnamed protein product [Prorocentrum cordatum]|uniref:Uncharacterized protein n=1 Tax=Prorocentrum cordatum TaxID=2364126 RepID=A0ABN9X276_9DINO|nr:unnamed protein product [Polarella glacialis]